MSLILIASLLTNITLATTAYKLWKKIPNVPKEESPVIKQLVESITKDSGWYYVPADRDKNTASAYHNKKMSLMFSIDETLRGGPRIYEPFKYNFNAHEVSIIKSALNDWGARLIMSKRIDALEEILNPEEDKLSQQIKEASATVRAERASKRKR